ncbi:MAG: hypothetical protein B7Z77_11710 [Acidocella sp. 20-58-15]|nr:MAG: hypothetical protein B7Z77_11710 [Acidocella sp. 20-58-15]
MTRRVEHFIGNEEAHARHVPHGAAIRSTPLAMLAGKSPAARGSAPFGLASQGFDRAALWGLLAVPGAKTSARHRRAEQRAGRAVEHHLDMVVL